MAYTRLKVLRNIEPPKPVTHVIVREVLEEDEVILFSATQQAIREIEQFGFGFINQKNHQKSGWCALIVNGCYAFDDVVRWMYEQATPEDSEVAA